jgi:hypothetical protein
VRYVSSWQLHEVDLQCIEVQRPLAQEPASSVSGGSLHRPRRPFPRVASIEVSRISPLLPSLSLRHHFASCWRRRRLSPVALQIFAPPLHRIKATGQNLDQASPHSPLWLSLSPPPLFAFSRFSPNPKRNQRRSLRRAGVVDQGSHQCPTRITTVTVSFLASSQPSRSHFPVQTPSPPPSLPPLRQARAIGGCSSNRSTAAQSCRGILQWRRGGLRAKFQVRDDGAGRGRRTLLSLEICEDEQR